MKSWAVTWVRFAHQAHFLASVSARLVRLVLIWLNNKQLNKRVDLSGRKCWIGISVSLENKHKTRGSVLAMSFSLALPCRYSLGQNASVCYLVTEMMLLVPQRLPSDGVWEFPQQPCHVFVWQDPAWYLRCPCCVRSRGCEGFWFTESRDNNLL